MPIYEYGCEDCGKTMEVLQKMSDPAPSECEYCGSTGLKKLMSQTSFQLKGDGWYITDYARKGKRESGDSKPESASESSESKSSESKNADKSTNKSDKAEKAEKKPKKAS